LTENRIHFPFTAALLQSQLNINVTAFLARAQDIYYIISAGHEQKAETVKAEK